MILQSLVSYYEALAATGDAPRQGWGRVRIQLALEIDEAGKLLSVQPLEAIGEKGKPTPRYLTLPTPVKRSSGVASNFLWDNAAYLLGIDSKGKPERAKICFEAAKEHHLALLSEVDDPFARAICAFFSRWTSGNTEEQDFSAYSKMFETGANLTFMFDGQLPPGNTALARAWQSYYDGADDESAEKLRCLITGEAVVPEKTHPAIKNVRNAQSSGAALVSFNAPAFYSYGREQNLNAPMSKYAAFAYTTALNQLLADSAHVKLIGGTTVVFWAECAQKQYQDVFGAWFDGDFITDNDMVGVMDGLAEGRAVRWNELPLEPQNEFYVLGISPNAARLSVRFFLSSTFESFARNLEAHFTRLEIVRPDFDNEEKLPLWKLLRETVNPNARDKSASPQMAGDTLRAILTDSRYPATLYQQTQLRIKADRNITRGRAAIIKAYLLKNMDDNFNKEALTVKLNEDTLYQPYVLGRLFSVLEAIQQKANPTINTTIKDKYFTSACATPAVVFPTLLGLAEKHLRKLDDKYRIWFSKQLAELTGRITESYPSHLNLNDQGIFQLGYYHQTQKRFEKKENKEDAANV